MDNHQTNAVDTMNFTDNSQGTSWQLIGLSPALADLTIDIDKSLSIGRSDSNNLVLATSQISRQHAKINCIGEQLYVQDLAQAMVPLSMVSVSVQTRMLCKPLMNLPLLTWYFWW